MAGVGAGAGIGGQTNHFSLADNSTSLIQKPEFVGSVGATGADVVGTQASATTDISIQSGAASGESFKGSMIDTYA